MRDFTKYLPRIGFDTPVEINELLQVARDDSELLICLRGKKIHIYYRGGKILGISPSRNSCKLDFDKKYLQITSLPFNLQWLSSYGNKDIIEEPKRFFSDAKEAMSLWFYEHPKQEREDQQKIALNNAVIEEEALAIVDIEYAVSFNSSCYNENYIETFETHNRYPNPRFDIIAIDKTGQIYILELKTGIGSTDNATTHITDFVAMIGSHNFGDNIDKQEPRYMTFLKEMDMMIDTLNRERYRHQTILLPKVNFTKKPIFGFVFTIETNPKSKGYTPEYQSKRITEIVKNSLSKAIAISEERGLGNDVQLFLNEGYILNHVIFVSNDYKLKI